MSKNLHSSHNLIALSMNRVFVIRYMCSVRPERRIVQKVVLSEKHSKLKRKICLIKTDN